MHLSHMEGIQDQRRGAGDYPGNEYRSVCLVQHGDRHTELLGFFLAYFPDARIDLVHRDSSQYTYIGYFERSLGLRFRRVLPEYDRRAHYDLVVLLSSDEAPMFRITVRKRVRRLLEGIGLEQLATRISIGMKERRQRRVDAQTATHELPLIGEPKKRPYRTPLFKNTRQTIALCHLAPRVTNECPNIALSPLLHALPWLLPVFDGLPTTNVDERRATICSMGLLEERYYQIIPTLARAMPHVELRLFVRTSHPECMALFAGIPNIVVVTGESTDTMMRYLTTSRFLLILDHAESRYRKDRLSGALPFGFNLGVPMVMSRQLAALNDIRGGVLTYDDIPDDDLVARMASMTPDAYRALVDDTLAERTRLARVAAQRFTGFLRTALSRSRDDNRETD